jgi:hypothetical protein
MQGAAVPASCRNCHAVSKIRGKCPIWVFLFFVSPKYFQFLDHSMTIKNYSFYSSNPFKYNFKGKFQSPLQNAKEQEF